MILSQLCRYLERRKRAPLEELSNRFDSDPDAMRAMLAALERKGRVARCTPTPACGTSCDGCDVDGLEVYEWMG